MKKCVSILFLVTVLNCFFMPQAYCARILLSFGDEEIIREISDVSLKGSNDEDLFLGYKITRKSFFVPLYFSDDGYVLGVKGDKASYFEMPTGENLRRLQEMGMLPAPLPSYHIGLPDYLLGYFIWSLIAFCIIGLVILAIIVSIAEYLGANPVQQKVLMKVCGYIVVFCVFIPALFYDDGTGSCRSSNNPKQQHNTTANTHPDTVNTSSENINTPIPVPGQDESEQTTFEELQQDALKGNSAAQFQLGNNYYYGRGVKVDQAEAAKWWHEAAMRSHAEAQYYLGNCYQYGQGVKEDQSEANKWWRNAAINGHIDALQKMDFMYRSELLNHDSHVNQVRQQLLGEDVTKDYGAALKMLQPAAEFGHVIAQSILGYLYINGEGVSENNEEAVKWFRLAAEQGNAPAQYYLGVCCYYGYGVEEDEEQAMKWYRLAADQGDEDALKMLEDSVDEDKPDDGALLSGAQTAYALFEEGMALSNDGNRQAALPVFEEMRTTSLELLEQGASDQQQQIIAKKLIAMANNNIACALIDASTPAPQNINRAIQLAEEAVKFSEGNANFMDTLASVYFAAGRINDAVKTQEASIAALPDGLFGIEGVDESVEQIRHDFEQRLKQYKDAQAAQ